MRSFLHHQFCSVAAVLAVASPLAAQTTQSAEPTLQQRLDRLVERLEEARTANNIAGMAIAVVKDDEVVLQRGFGLADLETERPVTPETIFAIGSTTKSFTAALCGMLVDEGVMNWDDPIAKFVPELDLQLDTDDENAEVTIRDCLSHQTGFTRMGVLWAGGAADRETIFRTASKAEPWAPYREKFYYNNVTYMAAGEACGSALDSTWEKLIRDRFFKPLGMRSSTLSVSVAQKDPRLALGYDWNEATNEFDHKKMRALDAIAPAGSINSNVVDMAQWLRLQLGHGVFEGERLLSDEVVEEMRTTQIDMGGGASYGLGWMMREWNDMTIIEHGGNIDGFSSTFAMIPESNIGFSLLMNTTVSMLQGASVEMVFDTLLGKWEENAESVSEIAAGDFDEFLGKYQANFAMFDDADFTVLEKNDRLAVDIPGQMVFELNPPNDEGKRTFAMTDQIAVSFERDDAGKVVGMKMYQAGMEFELPRRGVEIKPEIPLEELQPYLGKYHDERMGLDLTVLIQNNRLAIDVPGQMVFELHPPNDDGRWVFRATSTIEVEFNKDENGRIESLTGYQGGENWTAMRIESDEDEAATLPTVEEVLALRNSSELNTAFMNLGTSRMTGTIRLAQSGVEGTILLFFSGLDQYRTEMDFGMFGSDKTAYNGGRAWNDSTFQEFDELEGKFLEQARQGHPASIFGDWRQFFEKINVLRMDTFDDKDVVVMKLQHADHPATTVMVDPENGDVLRADGTMITPVGGIPVHTEFADYRDVKGVRIPFRMEVSNEMSGRAIMQFERIETNLKIGDGIFTLHPPAVDKEAPMPMPSGAGD